MKDVRFHGHVAVLMMIPK